MRLHLMQVARGGGLKGLTVDALVTLQRVRSCRSTVLPFDLPGRNADPLRACPLAGEQTGRCVTAALAVLRSIHETRVLRRLQTGCGRWRQSGRRDRRGEGHSAAWA